MVKKRTFYQQFGKRIFDFFFSLLTFLSLWPVFLIIAVAILLDSEGSILFQQKRIGRDGRVFLMYKFRTMVKNAEELKENYLQFNEADGPVFKIKDDPRFTKVGKFLARTGLDELPQFINVFKGEMAIVGPRPLPINEAKQITSVFKKAREALLPGMTSSWVVSGAHYLSFKQWMQLDQKYSNSVYLTNDFAVILKTVRMMVDVISKYWFNAD